LKNKQSAAFPPILTYAGLKCLAKLINLSSEIGNSSILLSKLVSRVNDKKLIEDVRRRGCSELNIKMCLSSLDKD